MKYITALFLLVLVCGCVDNATQDASTTTVSVMETSSTIATTMTQPRQTSTTRPTVTSTSTTQSTSTTILPTMDCDKIDHPMNREACAVGICPKTGAKCHFMAGSVYRPAVCKCF